MSETPKALNPLGPAVTGPVAKSRKKADLQNIADALGLDTAGTIDVLVLRIRAYMDANTAVLNGMPRFTGLFTFKSAPKAAKQDKKTSADKDAEDVAENLKSKSAKLTASEQKLNELKVTVEPPPSFKALGLQRGNNKPKTEVEIVEDGSSDLSSEYDAVFDDSKSKDKSDIESESEDKKKRKKDGHSERDVANEGHEIMTVSVKLESAHDLPHEMLIPGVEIIKTKSPSDGSIIHQTRLSELLPAVVEMNSPMKALGGHFMRTGLREDAQSTYMNAGTIEQHMQKLPIKALQLDAANLLDVKLNDKGHYGADIFWKLDQDPSHGASLQSKATILPVQPTSLTGSGSDKPLDIAKERDLHNIHKHENAMEKFEVYLLNFCGVDLEEYPNGPLETIADGLVQFRNYEAVLKTLKPWMTKKKGYIVPLTSPSFPGTKFTKATINSALGLAGSTINNIVSHFEPERLRHSPDAATWVQTNGVTNGGVYNHLKPIDFVKILKKNYKKRVRSESPSSTSSSESEPARSRKSKGKKKKVEKERSHKKHKKAINSEDIDE
ncbi:hypothetical protein C8R44DRAFT_799790 [Mycena epipterygia]|nr:hypothetical protein C8R44DRAFT_799790 [Mycena epipterygia]